MEAGGSHDSWVERHGTVWYHDSWVEQYCTVPRSPYCRLLPADLDGESVDINCKLGPSPPPPQVCNTSVKFMNNGIQIVLHIHSITAHSCIALNFFSFTKWNIKSRQNNVISRSSDSPIVEAFRDSLQSFACSSPAGGMLFGVSNNNNNNRRLVTLAEHTSDHGRQTNSSTKEKGEQV